MNILLKITFVNIILFECSFSCAGQKIKNEGGERWLTGTTV